MVTEREKRLTSYHEAGHAVCTYHCPTQDKVHQVSIIPRGMAGGFTMSLPEHDKSYVSKTEMKENIVTLLGGRVAEKLILEDISTGASNDIERATAIARNMVTKYGFSDKLGPMVYGTDQNEVFLGRDFNSSKNYSENVAAEIDAEMREIIEEGYERAKDLLEQNMDQLHLLAKYLMKYEKIDDVDFEKLKTVETKLKEIWVTGIRADEMAMRFKYAGISIEKIKVKKDYDLLIKDIGNYDGSVYMMPTYTAMLAIRKKIADKFGFKEFWK